MIRLSRIYTRTGDAGQTSLGNGSRVAKHGPRIVALGGIDEANAAVGLARLHADPTTEASLAGIQNDLFDVGADVCLPEPGEGQPPRAALRVTAAQVARLEQEIDAANARLAPLDSFILPGGSPAAAHLHFARTVVRRAERDLSALAAAEPVNPEALRYLNRLSDLLFVLARLANDEGRSDILWVPGGGR